MEREPAPIQGNLAAFFGVDRGVGTTTLAIQVAAAIGILGQYQTLLVDLSRNTTANAVEYLGLSGERNTPSLLRLWVETGAIPVDDLQAAVMPYSPPATSWPDGSALGVLAGFAPLTSGQVDRLRAYREAQFLDAVFQAAFESGYELVLVDAGVYDHDRTTMPALLPAIPLLVGTGPSPAELAAIKTISERLRVWYRRPIVHVLNNTSRLPLAVKIGGGFPEGYTTHLVKHEEGEDFQECNRTGVPYILLDMHKTPHRPGRFSSAIFELCEAIVPQITSGMRDGQGRSLAREDGLWVRLVGQ